MIVDKGRDRGRDKSDNSVRINDSIHCPMIRLVDENRIVTNEVAQSIAQSRGLDLVEVSYIRTERGPLSICKIIDYNKYIYNKKKADKENAKKARQNRMELKTIQFHITSDSADVERKINKAREFITEGDRVKIEIFLRGREELLVDMINDKMNYIVNKLTDIAIIDASSKKEGRTYSCILRPIDRKPHNTEKYTPKTTIGNKIIGNNQFKITIK